MPRIYVACLACYNEGRLHGKWIDADQDPDDIDQERKDLQEACGHADNDWAIHDFEGFDGIKLSEYESFAAVSKLAGWLEEHGAAFAAWYANESRDTDDDLGEAFQEAYLGTFDTLEAYAEDYIEQTGMLSGVDDTIARYFDYESFARDLELGGDVWTVRGGDGLFVFSNQ